jgi:2-methylisocitrate lyase-like PEP mutase family enzyme
MTQREKAEDLRRAHLEPALLVLVDVWDAASACTVAAAPGCRAPVTASWSIGGGALPDALAFRP